MIQGECACLWFYGWVGILCPIWPQKNSKDMSNKDMNPGHAYGCSLCSYMFVHDSNPLLWLSDLRAQWWFLRSWSDSFVKTMQGQQGQGLELRRSQKILKEWPDSYLKASEGLFEWSENLSISEHTQSWSFHVISLSPDFVGPSSTKTFGRRYANILAIIPFWVWVEMKREHCS